MEKINNICWTFICLLTSFIVGYVGGCYRVKYNTNTIDTTYNFITLDSIKYNIKEKDSVIYKLKLKFKDDVEKANSLNDSNAVVLFKKLVTR